MITFFVCLALLLIGYATYGAFVEKVFHPGRQRDSLYTSGRRS